MWFESPVGPGAVFRLAFERTLCHVNDDMLVQVPLPLRSPDGAGSWQPSLPPPAHQPILMDEEFATGRLQAQFNAMSPTQAPWRRRIRGGGRCQTTAHTSAKAEWKDVERRRPAPVGDQHQSATSSPRQILDRHELVEKTLRRGTPLLCQ